MKYFDGDDDEMMRGDDGVHVHMCGCDVVDVRKKEGSECRAHDDNATPRNILLW